MEIVEFVSYELLFIYSFLKRFLFSSILVLTIFSTSVAGSGVSPEKCMVVPEVS